MPLKWIVKVFSVINANRRPGEVAVGMALGFVMALQPGFTFFRALLLGITFLLKVHFPSALLALFLFSFLAPLFDPLLDLVGGFILTIPALSGFWSSLYLLPLFPLTRFYNTVVMGGLVVGLVLSVPIYLLVRLLIQLYRAKIRDAIAELPVVKAILKMPLVVRIGEGLKKIFSLTEGV
ncbi:MAG: TIGR03546 family protein [Spirochaetes bacterium]|nr:TIGR03546 family protein [Spirochaetota bacterium]